ncbi:MAG: Eco57I restriction-modification methylase domain-containing protein [Armatimonadetes bacterium]|nr:Eco57I restriction-modification methylase domain-containing protein [Armatimonadota bacterium]
MIPEPALQAVRDRESLFALLHGHLGWPVDPADTFTYDEPLPDGQDRADIAVSRLVPFSGDDPFALILAEFRSPFRRGALRKVLQGIRRNMRASAAYHGRSLEDLVFLCVLPDWEGVRFARFREQEGRQPKLAVFGWERVGLGATRTLREFNLPALRLGRNLLDEPDWSPAKIESWRSAWDVERVTKQFFEEYARVFQSLETAVGDFPDLDARRLYTQNLMNRILFCWFLQKKGWLNHQPDYLARLFDVACRDHERGQRQRQDNFLRDYLHPLFFEMLNSPTEERPANPRWVELHDRLGEIPFLNGGLFEPDPAVDDVVRIPNDAFRPVFDLFGRYQFTITESTPDDVEVAVDPEMLGKVFEELVTGRHESGSYYTPKPVVSFMCREALKCYLETNLERQPAEGIADFVDRHEPNGMRQPEAVLEALKKVRVCDPACGSGAYLLGMLHELLDLRACLFATRQLDPVSVYQRKLQIIQNNVHGVDIDPFAVNIARLRLWLSLSVDYEGARPEPLPNLDFKVEVGDSLLGPSPHQTDLIRQPLIEEFRGLKREYLMAHGAAKRRLRGKIDDVRAEIARHERRDGQADGFDWQVEFAEVFLPEEPMFTIGGASTSGQGLTAQPRSGGFDIIVANPPYVRMELFKPIKPRLRRLFAHVHSDRADLYVYFYARAHELLCDGGAACFISSDKWLRSGYGERLRQLLMEEQDLRLVVDFGELPVFGAATFPGIFLWCRHPHRGVPALWAAVRDLGQCYEEGVGPHARRIGTIGPNAPTAGTATGGGRAATLTDRLADCVPLAQYLDSGIYSGIKTGCNDAFWLDEDEAHRILAAEPACRDLIKPLRRGDDIRKWHVRESGLHVIYTPLHTRIENYPAVLAHLRQHSGGLRARAGAQPWWALQQAQYRDGVWETSKIVYPDICKESRFVMDTTGLYFDMKGFIIPEEDWFLLGVLNPGLAWRLFQHTCAVLGDPHAGGRLQLKRQYVDRLPIPVAGDNDRREVARLATSAQALAVRRHSTARQFATRLGVRTSSVTSRNALEEPWLLTVAEFRAQARRKGVACDEVLFREVHDTTAELTEKITHVEAEIDERVAGLYGL